MAADDDYDFSGISSGGHLYDVASSLLANWRAQDDDEEDDDYSYFWPDQPPYDIQEKLREINKVHQEDETPVESDRERKVKFNSRVLMRAISMRRDPQRDDDEDDDEPFNYNELNKEEDLAEFETPISTPRDAPETPAPPHLATLSFSTPTAPSPAAPAHPSADQHASSPSKTTVAGVGRGLLKSPDSTRNGVVSSSEPTGAVGKGLNSSQKSPLSSRLAEDRMSILSLDDDDDIVTRPGTKNRNVGRIAEPIILNSKQPETEQKSAPEPEQKPALEPEQKSAPKLVQKLAQESKLSELRSKSNPEPVVRLVPKVSEKSTPESVQRSVPEALRSIVPTLEKVLNSTGTISQKSVERRTDTSSPSASGGKREPTEDAAPAVIATTDARRSQPAPDRPSKLQNMAASPENTPSEPASPENTPSELASPESTPSELASPENTPSEPERSVPSPPSPGSTSSEVTESSSSPASSAPHSTPERTKPGSGSPVSDSGSNIAAGDSLYQGTELSKDIGQKSKPAPEQGLTVDVKTLSSPREGNETTSRLQSQNGMESPKIKNDAVLNIIGVPCNMNSPKSDDSAVGSMEEQPDQKASGAEEPGSDGCAGDGMGHIRSAKDHLSAAIRVMQQANAESGAAPRQRKPREPSRSRPAAAPASQQPAAAVPPAAARPAGSGTAPAARTGSGTAARSKSPAANRRPSPLKKPAQASPQKEAQRPASAPPRPSAAARPATSRTSFQPRMVRQSSEQQADTKCTLCRSASQEAPVTFEEWLDQHERERARIQLERKNSARKRKQEALLKKEKAPQAFRVWLRKKRQQRLAEQRQQQLRQTELMVAAAEERFETGRRQDSFRQWLQRKQQERGGGGGGGGRPRPQATLRSLSSLYSVHPPYTAAGGDRPASAAVTSAARSPHAQLHHIYGPHAPRGVRSKAAKLYSS